MPAIARPKYDRLKAKLIARGSNLRRWAIDNALPLGSVYNAVKGTRKGIKATRIRKQLEDYLNE